MLIFCWDCTIFVNNYTIITSIAIFQRKIKHDKILREYYNIQLHLGASGQRILATVSKSLQVRTANYWRFIIKSIKPTIFLLSNSCLSTDNSSHVLSEDTICRELRNDGKLYSKRLLTKTNRVPKWGERFFKAKSVAIVEESIFDLKKRELVTYTRNIGFNKIMVSQMPTLCGLFFCLGFV